MSERLFTLLLRLYPRRFRSEYGEDMRQVFRDRLKTESRVRLWMEVLLDAAVAIPREHRRPLSDVAPHGYRMSEAAVNSMVRQGHRKQVPLLVAATLLAALLAWAGNAPPIPLCIVYGLLLWVATAPLRGLERLREHWRGYELVCDGDQLQQLQRGVVVATLHRSEVARLMEDGGFGLVVQSPTEQRSIWIPAAVNGYEELRARLAGWGQLERSRERHGYLFLGHFGLHWIALIYPAAVLSRSPQFAIGLSVVAASGILFLLTMFVRTRQQQPVRIPLIVGLVPLGLLVILAVRLFFVVG